MRERALEMDSHQECIGSEEWPLEAELLFGLRWWEEEEEEEGERWKSMAVEMGKAPSTPEETKQLSLTNKVFTVYSLLHTFLLNSIQGPNCP